MEARVEVQCQNKERSTSPLGQESIIPNHGSSWDKLMHPTIGAYKATLSKDIRRGTGSTTEPYESLIVPANAKI